MGQLNAAIIPVTPFQQNCTILFDPDTRVGVVVDPGGDVDMILSAIREAELTIEAIWITHGHIDHAGGAMELKETLGVDIIGPHEADRDLLSNIELQAQRFGVPGTVRNCTPDRYLTEGEIVSFGSHSFEVLPLPGPCARSRRLLQRRRALRACRRRAVSRFDRQDRSAWRQSRSADLVHQGQAAAAGRRDRLHLRARTGRPFRRRTTHQPLSRLIDRRIAGSIPPRMQTARWICAPFSSDCRDQLLEAISSLRRSGAYRRSRHRCRYAD